MTEQPDDLIDEGSGSGEGEEEDPLRWRDWRGDYHAFVRIALALESLEAAVRERPREHQRAPEPPGMWWAPGTVRRLVAHGLITAAVYGATLCAAWLVAGFGGLILVAAGVVAVEAASHDPHGDRGWWRWPSIREQVQLLVLMRRAIRDGTRRP